ncbi:gamma-glutamylcyclotransferase family protein [Fontimonas sp. SYSU GA230001]|uniref:gamma-glutamylcyclotransferase family protein n=1 Tax=Fontimonas sp. SYSU GA230001 TaxID=3142450 RepID=UPI0032B5091B
MTHPVRVFVYGSLLVAAVLRAVLRRPAALQAARLDGYARRALRGSTFPGVVRRSGGITEGALALLSVRELRRLDRFEDDHYRRRPVRVTLADGRRITAQTYVLERRSRSLLARRDWSPSRLAGGGAARLVRAARAVTAAGQSGKLAWGL